MTSAYKAVQTIGKAYDSEVEHAASVRALPYEWRSDSGWEMRRFATRDEVVAFQQENGGTWFERGAL